MNEKEKMGSKIRYLRKSKELSLSELAQKIDKTSSYLSQIERGLAEPSLQALREISGALDTPIFYFLVDEKKYNKIVRKEERKRVRFPDSNLSVELISASANKQIEMLEASLEPGAKTNNKPITHEGEECILVKKGRMKINVGDEEYNLKEGDSIYLLSGMSHSIENTSKNELVFILALTPPTL
jgi:transcriptional regulator with XRE-family HTH domain